MRKTWPDCSALHSHSTLISTQIATFDFNYIQTHHMLNVIKVACLMLICATAYKISGGGGTIIWWWHYTVLHWVPVIRNCQFSGKTLWWHCYPNLHQLQAGNDSSANEQTSSWPVTGAMSWSTHKLATGSVEKLLTRIKSRHLPPRRKCKHQGAQHVTVAVWHTLTQQLYDKPETNFIAKHDH